MRTEYVKIRKDFGISGTTDASIMQLSQNEKLHLQNKPEATLHENISSRNIIAISPICGARRRSQSYRKNSYNLNQTKGIIEKPKKDFIDVLSFPTPEDKRQVSNLNISSKRDEISCKSKKENERKQSVSFSTPQENSKKAFKDIISYSSSYVKQDESSSSSSVNEYPIEESKCISINDKPAEDKDIERKQSSRTLKTIARKISDTINTISKEKNDIEYMLHQSYRTLKSSQGERVLEALSCQLIMNKHKTGVMSFTNLPPVESTENMNMTKPVPLIEVSRQKTESSESDNDGENVLTDNILNKLDVSPRRQTNASCSSNRITYEQWVTLKNEQYRRHSVGVLQLRKKKETLIELQKRERCKQKMSYCDWLEEKNRTINESKIKMAYLKKLNEQKKQDEIKRLELQRKLKYEQWLSEKYKQEIEREETLLLKTRCRGKNKNSTTTVLQQT